MKIKTYKSDFCDYTYNEAVHLHQPFNFYGGITKQTLAVCEPLNLSVYLLTELSDIVDENDLDKVKEQLLLKQF